MQLASVPVERNSDHVLPQDYGQYCPVCGYAYSSVGHWNVCQTTIRTIEAAMPQIARQ